MSKAVLVLEDMPERCYDCSFMDADEACLAMSVSYTDVDTLKEKPDWCPLRRLPERRKPLNKKGYRSGYIEGWNDAVDAINQE